MGEKIDKSLSVIVMVPRYLGVDIICHYSLNIITPRFISYIVQFKFYSFYICFIFKRSYIRVFMLLSCAVSVIFNSFSKTFATFRGMNTFYEENFDLIKGMNFHESHSEKPIGQSKYLSIEYLFETYTPSPLSRLFNVDCNIGCRFLVSTV